MTLRCKLFGHNFIVKYLDPEAGEGNSLIKLIDYCVRCGALNKAKLAYNSSKAKGGR